MDFEKLNLFFDKIKSIGFWRRIFGWQQIRNLSYDAYGEFKELLTSLGDATKQLDQAQKSIEILKNDKEHFQSEKIRLENSSGNFQRELDAAREQISQLKPLVAAKDAVIKSLEGKVGEQNKDLALLQERVDGLTEDTGRLRNDNAILRQAQADLEVEYKRNVAVLNDLKNKIEIDRDKEQEERQAKELERIQSMKETWSNHQEAVKNAIKMICERHTIEYVQKVPFRGTPDNTIKLCDEFLIFDAKSPLSDDLSNFPNYIKSQTESVKKYIKESGVRKDIFLVIPSNTVDVIKSFCYNMADYTVYVVTLDVLEPLILALRRIEDYEFVNQLSPEDRENICRIIGKFAHMTKRRIQIDQFFSWEFLDILTKCKANLPKEILDKVIEFERSEKLNPPQEKRAKQILTADLKSDNQDIKKEAEAKGIAFPAALPKNIKTLPLYENEKLDVTEV